MQSNEFSEMFEKKPAETQLKIMEAMNHLVTQRFSYYEVIAKDPCLESEEKQAIMFMTLDFISTITFVKFKMLEPYLIPVLNRNDSNLAEVTRIVDLLANDLQKHIPFEKELLSKYIGLVVRTTTRKVIVKVKSQK